MPLPLIVGGLAALAGGALNAYSTYKQGQDTKDMYGQLGQMASEVEAKNANDIARYNAFLEKQYGGDAAKYSDALQAYMAKQFSPYKDFGYQGEINDYMDPARNQRVEAAMRSLERQGADGGNSFSSDFMNRMAGQQQAMASEEWQNSYNRLVQDRQQQLAAYNANAQNFWNNYNADNARDQYALGQLGGAKDAYANGYGSVLSAGMANRTAGLQSQANALAGAQNASNQQSNWMGQLVGPAAQFLGAYYGAQE